jgi:hypothetical protein
MANPHFPHYAEDTSTNPRCFIIALGGYQKVAQRLGKSDSTVQGASRRPQAVIADGSTRVRSPPGPLKA